MGLVNRILVGLRLAPPVTKCGQAVLDLLDQEGWTLLDPVGGYRRLYYRQPAPLDFPTNAIELVLVDHIPKRVLVSDANILNSTEHALVFAKALRRDAQLVAIQEQRKDVARAQQADRVRQTVLGMAPRFFS
jgi:hypothetical protein